MKLKYVVVLCANTDDDAAGQLDGHNFIHGNNNNNNNIMDAKNNTNNDD